MPEILQKTNSRKKVVFNHPLKKDKITVLQVNLGRKCNLACIHCHVEASPLRKEEITEEIKNDIIEVIKKFPQIQSVDLTGGAPEMHHGFKEIVKVAREHDKEVIVRSNLTIFYEKGYEDLPDFFKEHKVRVTASLPCYLEDNVDAQRGKGTFDKSIQAIKDLNERGYGKDLTLDLVYNPAVPVDENFKLCPDQKSLDTDYRKFLGEKFGITFNNLFTVMNIPIGRFKKYLQIKKLDQQYLEFLQDQFNEATLPHLMCKNELSVDYEGNIYDCDFNQMEAVPALAKGKKLTLKDLLAEGSLDLIENIQIRDYCYGCTAGAGSSCGGALLD